MRVTTRLFPLLLLIAAAGCGSGSTSAPSSGTTSTPSSTTTSTTEGDGVERAIAEADIVQLKAGRLYAMSKSGTVSIIDVSVPGRLVLLGQTALQGQPFEMYLRGDFLIAMSNGAVATDGSLGPSHTDDEAASAIVVVVDVHDPGRPAPVGSFTVPGEIADSRIVGNVLYLASYENVSCFRCGPAPRTMVTTFNVATPMAIAKVDQVSFESNAPDGYNLPWGTNWKRSIFVTDARLYIGGHADIDPGAFGTAPEGIIDVLDITDPSGRLGTGARLRVAGALLSRWQLDETDGILRVISQRGAGRTGNGLAAPEIETFRVLGAQSFTPLGKTTMRLPRQEGLRTVRFDGPRAYAITYNQTDPMFVIDLSEPGNPRQLGSLFMPGFMYYLEPHGNRVIGLGIDRTDPHGSLNVSLFDVSDGSAPRIITRVAFGSAGLTEDYAILNSEVSEDQDRIQKAFHVLPDGLVVVPFSMPLPYYSDSSSCANAGGGVQLIAWRNDRLEKHALLPLSGHPRRAFENGTEMDTVSDSNVRAFSLANLDVAHETADLAIGVCTPTPSAAVGGLGNGRADGNQEYGGPPACSWVPKRGGGGPGPAFVALIAIAAASRRRRRDRLSLASQKHRLVRFSRSCEIPE